MNPKPKTIDYVQAWSGEGKNGASLEVIDNMYKRVDDVRDYLKSTDDDATLAFDVFKQLVTGPIWDGNITSKRGRDILVDLNLAFRSDGYQSLTPDGVVLARKMNLLQD